MLDQFAYLASTPTNTIYLSSDGGAPWVAHLGPFNTMGWALIASTYPFDNYP